MEQTGIDTAGNKIFLKHNLLHFPPFGEDRRGSKPVI